MAICWNLQTGHPSGSGKLVQQDGMQSSGITLTGSKSVQQDGMWSSGITLAGTKSVQQDGV